MDSVSFHELEFSRLMLGTVQFGMDYGIANRTGQPAYEDVRDILACAYEGGVTCLDTASAYGTSEEILGRALADLDIADKMVTVTKIQHIDNNNLSSVEVDNHIEQSVVNSLRRLRMETLPICLFHLEEDFRYVDSLLKLKAKGLVRHIGCSVMTPEATSCILATGLAVAIQIPVNVLDRRFAEAGVCTQAQQNATAVFGRSIYLQGLLLLPEAEIPAALETVIPVRRKLQALADEAGMGLAELAGRYMLGQDWLTCALVGVDSLEQMRANVTLFKKGPLETSLSAAVTAAVPALPDTILKPNLWPARSARPVNEKGNH